MKKYFNIYIILVIILISISVIGWFNYYSYYNRKINNQISGYLKTLEKVERGFIENIPIYEDYITAEKEKKLRKENEPSTITEL